LGHGIKFLNLKGSDPAYLFNYSQLSGAGKNSQFSLIISIFAASKQPFWAQFKRLFPAYIAA
jgi:hypothetical protein